MVSEAARSRGKRESLTYAPLNPVRSVARPVTCWLVQLEETGVWWIFSTTRPSLLGDTIEVGTTIEVTHRVSSDARDTDITVKLLDG